MQEKHKEIDEYLQKQVEELEKISGYSREEARHLLLEEIEKTYGKMLLL